MTTTPASLLQRLRQAPDEASWARFAEIYTPLLYHWARRVGLAPADASDLVQDVFVLLVQKLPELQHDPSKRFRGWLRAVTLNRWREKARKKAPAPAADLGDIPDRGVDEAFWELEYRQRVVDRALELMRAEFEPATWRAFWEVAANGRRAADVGAELGLSANAVHIAKSRVLRRLREELADMLD
jgi:RNA polymerase sigma-70 factor (ECF subfamily)